jgi:hypothetical protein
VCTDIDTDIEGDIEADIDAGVDSARGRVRGQREALALFIPYVTGLRGARRRHRRRRGAGRRRRSIRIWTCRKERMDWVHRRPAERDGASAPGRRGTSHRDAHA